MIDVSTQVELTKQSGTARFYNFGERVARGGFVPSHDVAQAISDAGLTTREYEDFVFDCKRRLELMSVLCEKPALKAKVADLEHSLMPLRAKAEVLRVQRLDTEAKRDEINRVLQIDHEQAKTEIKQIEARWPRDNW